MIESSELRGLAVTCRQSPVLVDGFTKAADRIDQLEVELRECRGSLVRWKAAVESLTAELEQVYGEKETDRDR